ncbi:MAG: hypothetical protein JXK94_06165 [Deltaproteobacteria bacterium]|nr:hypothetical protein [Deltaproteobacteria bacterium]
MGDFLSGMKAIRAHLNGISEATVLEYCREEGLPIKKTLSSESGQARKAKLMSGRGDGCEGHTNLKKKQFCLKKFRFYLTESV